MPVRTGSQYLDGLRDDRQIFVAGERVEDVTAYAPFEGILSTLGRMYDAQHEDDHASVLTFDSPADGQPVSVSFLEASSWEGVHRRVVGETARVDLSYGLLGRLPDYMAAFVTDLAAVAPLLGQNRPEFGENIVRYHALCRDNDLALTHTLIDPQIDRSKGVEEQDTMRVIEETSDGLVVQGAKLLSTLAPLSDEIVVAPFTPRTPGQEAYTLSCAIPVASPGLKFICRESYDETRNSYDRPLSSRFDEQDALAIFDNVLVPWDRVFAYGDIDTYNKMMPSLPGYSLLQAAIRGTGKLRTVIGIADLMAETNGRSEVVRYREIIGELVLLHEIALGLVNAIAHEVLHNLTSSGAANDLTGSAGADVVSGTGPLFGAKGRSLVALSTIRIFLPYAHKQAMEALTAIGSSSLIMTMTHGDTVNAEVSDDIDRYLRGRNDVAASERVRLFKLAWELVGEQFGSRSFLYESFFGGDPINNRIAGYSMPGRASARTLAERLFAEVADDATRIGS